MFCHLFINKFGDVSLSFMHIISNMEIIYTEKYSFYTINGVIGNILLKEYHKYMIIFIFTFCQYFCYLSLSISFFYKFISVCKNEKYNRKLLFEYIASIVIISFILALIQISILTFACEKDNKQIMKNFLADLNVSKMNVLIFDRMHYGFVIFEFFIVIFVVMSFLTIIIFALMVLQKINSNKIKKTGRTVELRKRMRSVIIMQIMNAFIFTIVPVCLMSLYFFKSLYFSSLGYIILIMTSYLPLSNTIIDILYTYDYKYRVLEILFPNKRIHRQKRYHVLSEIFQLFSLVTTVFIKKQSEKLILSKKKGDKVIRSKANCFCNSEVNDYLGR
uniref:G_PROTEIN_RECEP_F1_2 domain-containing protein n=1 Tax=Parastrongyloides trichosuri TaxID=131310 RepID=A0A0N4Z4D2_PARTI